jgi:hypothetical protein
MQLSKLFAVRKYIIAFVEIIWTYTYVSVAYNGGITCFHIIV